MMSPLKPICHPRLGQVSEPELSEVWGKTLLILGSCPGVLRAWETSGALGIKPRLAAYKTIALPAGL